MKANPSFIFLLILIKGHHFEKLRKLFKLQFFLFQPSTFSASGFQKCDIRKPDFDRCLSQAIQGAIEQLKKPIDDYGLPQMEPFIAPKYVRCELGNETNGIRQKYFNYKVSGLTKIVKTDAK